MKVTDGRGEFWSCNNDKNAWCLSTLFDSISMSVPPYMFSTLKNKASKYLYFKKCIMLKHWVFEDFFIFVVLAYMLIGYCPPVEG